MMAARRAQRRQQLQEPGVSLHRGIWNSTRSRRNMRPPEPHIMLTPPRRLQYLPKRVPTRRPKNLRVRKISVCRLEQIMEHPNMATSEEKILYYFLKHFWERYGTASLVRGDPTDSPIVEFRTTDDPEEAEYLWNLDYKGPMPGADQTPPPRRGYRAPEISSIPKPKAFQDTSQPESPTDTPQDPFGTPRRKRNPDASEEEF
ncbi:hypothetical protein CAEBREN_13801 [Caenorhabditis brenneri]|uniref:Uncharacterized protein n=1 Tax=Caenorhabditis brenneri TaxID=135651 RepID=G0PBG6_CAEBE|nr:hypothetical protein CAEBREN_13801 [Caenorhabditis brenneri]